MLYLLIPCSQVALHVFGGESSSARGYANCVQCFLDVKGKKELGQSYKNSQVQTLLATAYDFPDNRSVVAVFPKANKEGHCLQCPKNIHPVQTKRPLHSPSTYLDMHWCCAALSTATYGVNFQLQAENHMKSLQHATRREQEKPRAQPLPAVCNRKEFVG